MQMSHFHEILIKLSLKYIPCSLKRCNIHVCILNGYKVMPFWYLKGPFRTTAIISMCVVFTESFHDKKKKKKKNTAHMF